MRYRLGVFGGMFDPVHEGHYKAALFALDELSLDKLKLVPCHVPNHRQVAIASPEQRVRMLGLATQWQSKLEVDTIELDRTGVSYMVETLTQLADSHSDASIVLVLGLDSFNSLPSWHRFSDMSEKCHLLVLSRPGASIDEMTETLVRQYWSHKESAEELFAAQSGNFLLAKNIDFDLSSTAVRKAINKGQALAGLLAPNVADYIASEKLYGNPPSFK
ncbi:MAG: nicotinate-nucleotide adenylyltransferase [Pseudohongiellaceae bacterium]